MSNNSPRKLKLHPIFYNQQAQSLLVCCISSFFLLLPILQADSWYISRQGYRYPYLLELFQHQFLAGNIYPRWLPELFGGYGNPTFIYYPPGFWFLSLPLSLIFNPPTACKFTLILMLTLGGLGIIRLASHYCTLYASWAIAALFYLTPTVSYALFQRGDLSELLALLLCPWVTHHLLCISAATHKRKTCFTSVLYLAITTTVSVYTHPLTFVWLCFILIPLIIALWLNHPQRYHLLTRFTFAATFTTCLTAPYWQPFLTLRNASDLSASITVATHPSTNIYALFCASSPYLGPLLPLLALLGAFISRRNPVMVAATIAYGACLLYMLPLTDGLRENIHWLAVLQWPTRATMVIPVLQCLLLSALCQRISPQLLLLPIALQLSINMLHYTPLVPLDYPSFAQGIHTRFDDMTHMHEFRPIHASLTGLSLRHETTALATTLNGDAVTTESIKAMTDFHLSTTLTQPSSITIKQFFYPGWHIEIDDSQNNSVAYDNQGLLTTPLLPMGKHKLHVWYEGPALAATRNALSLLGALLSLAALWKLRLPRSIKTS